MRLTRAGVLWRLGLASEPPPPPAVFDWDLHLATRANFVVYGAPESLIVRAFEWGEPIRITTSSGERVVVNASQVAYAARREKEGEA